jgi:ATP-dependent helicase HepA
MGSFLPGMKVIHRAHPRWGVGTVRAVLVDEGRMEVDFPGRAEGTALLSEKDPELVRHRLHLGDSVILGDGTTATVGRALPATSGSLNRYALIRGQAVVEATEDAFATPPPRPGPLDALIQGHLSDLPSFQLRRRALQLDLERRSDALGALFSSRVMVKPHQVAVVQRVLAARQPRFVLADEVGLGKTIEAGLALSALVHSGLARRVLVVAPSHLTVQWLAEMFHKFNLLFTLLDSDRIADERKIDAGRSPWTHYPRIIVSLEMLARGGPVLDGATSADAAWDLVIIDEAHHLRAAGAFEVASRLAAKTWGLLLLTATPLQLDPEEYYRLLSLVEPVPSTSLGDFRERMERQDDLSALARALIERSDPSQALQRVRRLLEKDDVVRPLIDDPAGVDPETLLRELARGYSLSSRLIRNRRVTVGGFERRKLQIERVSPGRDELDLQSRARHRLSELASERAGPAGAALASVLRRLDSSPPALAAALGASGDAQLGALARAASERWGVTRDAKLRTLVELLARIDGDERRAKVLIFAEARETLDYLTRELAQAGVTTLPYHGGLSTLERDRNVARFRDPDGPRVLLTSELGGEGRNFQFCHHLVNYDLAWSPATLEQRVGRVDRIGQRHPVKVYVFRPEGTLAASVTDLMVGTVRVFEETIGGLDAVLEETEGELVRLALTGADDAAFRAYASALNKRIGEARARAATSYDPLLDRRSFDREGVRERVDRAAQRLAVAGIENEDLEEALVLLSRELEERLEDTVTEIALGVGIGVDVDEQVDAFQCAFHLGHALKVDALPGIDITHERTYLGTFWRDTAVEQEEIEHFTTGHPLVEALFTYLRDGEQGRAAALRVAKTGLSQSRALLFSFVIEPPVAEDLEQGAQVASRQAMRYLETRSLHEVIEIGRGGSLTPRPAWTGPLSAEDAKFSRWPDPPERGASWKARVSDAADLAALRAKADLEAAKDVALRKLTEEADEAVRILDRWLRFRGATAETAGNELGRERAAFDAIGVAIRGCRLELDAAAVVEIES